MVAAKAARSTQVIGELVNGGVSCDEWTTFEITKNTLTLRPPRKGPFSGADGPVFKFNNVRFVVYSGTLLVGPKVDFTGTEVQVFAS